MCFVSAGTSITASTVEMFAILVVSATGDVQRHAVPASTEAIPVALGATRGFSFFTTHLQRRSSKIALQNTFSARSDMFTLL
eukprot:s1339_g16.t1